MTDQAAPAATGDNGADAGTLDGDGQTSTEELDPVALKQQLAEKDEYISKLQGSQGSLLQKLDQTAERVMQLEGRLGEQRDILAGRQEPAQPTKNPWEIEDADRETFQNSPDKIVDFTKERFLEQERKINGLVKQIADLLETRDGSIEQRFATLQQEMRKSDPERKAFEGAIEELKKDPVLADLDEEKLLAIARRTNMKPDYEFTGSPGGRPVAAAARSAPVDRRSRDEIFTGFMAIYGDQKRAEKATANYVAKNKAGAR